MSPRAMEAVHLALALADPECRRADTPPAAGDLLEQEVGRRAAPGNPSPGVRKPWRYTP